MCLKDPKQSLNSLNRCLTCMLQFDDIVPNSLILPTNMCMPACQWEFVEWSIPLSRITTKKKWNDIFFWSTLLPAYGSQWTRGRNFPREQPTVGSKGPKYFLSLHRCPDRRTIESLCKQAHRPRPLVERFYFTLFVARSSMIQRIFVVRYWGRNVRPTSQYDREIRSPFTKCFVGVGGNPRPTMTASTRTLKPHRFVCFVIDLTRPSDHLDSSLGYGFRYKMVAFAEFFVEVIAYSRKCRSRQRGSKFERE